MADQPGSIVTADADKTAAGTGGENAEGAKTAEQIAAEAAAEQTPEQIAAEKATADAAAAAKKNEGKTPEKIEAEKKAADKKAADLKELHGAPEQYGDFTMPDGVEVDKARLEEITPVFKELNLSQKGSQKLVDFYAKTVADTQKANAEAWQATRGQWKEALKADKEIGGEKFDAQVALAKKGLAHFGTPELVKYLDEYGGGDHPEVIRLLARVGSIVTEDTVKFGKVATPAATSDPAAAMFPSMAPKT